MKRTMYEAARHTPKPGAAGSNPVWRAKLKAASASGWCSFKFGAKTGKDRTGRRTAVRKKHFGGMFFSPRVDSRRLHQVGSYIFSLWKEAEM